MAILYKSQIVSKDGVISLIFADGKNKVVNIEQLQHYLLTFNDPHYYSSEIVSEIESSTEDLLAIVNPFGNLIVFNPHLFNVILNPSVRYIPLTEYAKKFNKQRSILCRYCREGRIPGAIQQEQRWLIPEDAPYPEMGKRGRKSE